MFLSIIHSEKCHLPLGFEHGIIKDENITSSSFYNDSKQAYFARLRNDSYWRPSPDDIAPWIQVSFQYKAIISGLVLQGSGADDGWVEEIEITYSSDGIDWITYVNLFDNSDKPEVREMSNDFI